MITTGITQEAFLSQLEVGLKCDYTPEQKELIKYFGDGPVFCFADPGTGKTYTAIGGLFNAELYKQIPGQNIYALSFTRLATGELSSRHQRACEKLGVGKLVNFQTIHSLCRSILKENYSLLGMSKFDSTGALTMEKAYNLVEGSAQEIGITVNPNQIRAIIKACSALNSSMTFDKDVVVTKMKFKECNVDYDTFDKVRCLLFAYSLLSETISVSDILLYTVLLLQRHPEISDAFKKKCRLLLVDEAQDLTLLQLRIISLLTDNPVLIGDMKQQIYGFSGACQEVVAEFHKLFPNCRDLRLSQSFRCKNEIAEFATRIILPNKIGGEDYKGVGPGGKVQLLRGFGEDGMNVKKLVANIKEEFIHNRNRLVKEYLFLTRNNISIIPIIEELYQKELPFRVNNFNMAYQIPIISDLVKLVLLATQPDNPKNISALQYIMPEFRGYYNIYEHPLYQACSQTGSNVFTVNYQYRDQLNASKAIPLLMSVRTMVDEGKPVKDIFNALWPMYNENWLTQNVWRLDNKPNYYLAAVEPLVYKDFATFLNDEVAKANIIQESDRYERGVRCYTIHASKGLEADVVYILDADEGIIPNTKELDKMLKKDCDLDVARAIREERSLCYVACTRAKEELYIVYNEMPSPIILGDNPYETFDQLYSMYRSTGDDITAFHHFAERALPRV